MRKCSHQLKYLLGIIQSLNKIQEWYSEMQERIRTELRSIFTPGGFTHA